MAADDVGREALRLAAALPVAVAQVVLGAGVLIARALRGRLASLLPWTEDAPAPRHHAGRVKEHARAAERAARASGLLRRDR